MTSDQLMNELAKWPNKEIRISYVASDGETVSEAVKAVKPFVLKWLNEDVIIDRLVIQGESLQWP
jgi:hypothetical protein